MSVLLLGFGFTGMALFSTAVVCALSKVGKEGSSLMRVGQPRLMSRAEKRAIECFVSSEQAMSCSFIIALNSGQS